MIGYLTQNHPLIQAFTPAPARRTWREAGASQRLIKAAPTLADYLCDGEVVASKGPLDRPIAGLAIDSRRVVPGMVFFALPGRRTDGRLFIDEAVSRGAVAIVAQGMPSLPPARVTFVQVRDARATLAAVAQRFYRFPDREMTVVGVTGTLKTVAEIGVTVPMVTAAPPALPKPAAVTVPGSMASLKVTV